MIVMMTCDLKILSWDDCCGCRRPSHSQDCKGVLLLHHWILRGALRLQEDSIAVMIAAVQDY